MSKLVLIRPSHIVNSNFDVLVDKEWIIWKWNLKNVISIKW